MIFCRRSAVSWSGRLYALETVLRDTPTASAIVCNVTFAMTGTPVSIQWPLNRYSKSIQKRAQPYSGAQTVLERDSAHVRRGVDFCTESVIRSRSGPPARA